MCTDVRAGGAAAAGGLPRRWHPRGTHPRGTQGAQETRAAARNWCSAAQNLSPSSSQMHSCLGAGRCRDRAHVLPFDFRRDTVLSPFPCCFQLPIKASPSLTTGGPVGPAPSKAQARRPAAEQPRPFPDCPSTCSISPPYRLPRFTFPFQPTGGPVGPAPGEAQARQPAARWPHWRRLRHGPHPGARRAGKRHHRRPGAG